MDSRIKTLGAALVLALVAMVPIDASAAAKAATVVCKDGTTDEGGRGACSGHGGVDKAATEARADEAVGMVVCKDGTESKGGRGACTGHGGVDKSGKAKAKKVAREVKAKDDDTVATVVCKDGTESKGGRGACSGHGGVDESGKAKVKQTSTSTSKGAAADPSKGPPTARCQDGTLSYADHHTGACSQHGGVAEWLDPK